MKYKQRLSMLYVMLVFLMLPLLIRLLQTRLVNESNGTFRIELTK
jgi:hypothetical protein